MWSNISSVDYVPALCPSFTASCNRLTRGSWFSVNIQSAVQPSSSRDTLWSRVLKCTNRFDALSDELQRKKASKKKRTPTPAALAKYALRKAQAAERRVEKAKKKQADKEQKAREAGKPIPKPPKKRKLPQTTSCPGETPKTKKPKKPPAQRARSALLELDPYQRALLIRWFGAYRWTYNRCVQASIEKDSDDLISLRERFVNSDSSYISEHAHWITEIPYNLRYEAVREFASAKKAAMTRLQNEHAKGNTAWTFKMKYRSKKHDSEAIALPARYWKDGIPFGTYWRKKPCECTPPSRSKPCGSSFDSQAEAGALNPLVSRRNDLPETLGHDSRILRKGGKFYLSVALSLPSPRTGIPEHGKAPKHRGLWLDNQEPRATGVLPPPSESVVAIDPGVRTFATLYDPNGKCLEWAPKDISRIQRLCAHMDKLTSRSQFVKARTRHRMKIALRRAREKVRHLVDEVHVKLARFLCENYNVVLLPKFEASRMVCRGGRKFGSKTARAMLGWSHYKFRMRLLAKAAEYPWCKVVECREDYTSKTCGQCGSIHEKLGGNKTFKCPVCGFTLDRDLNGARNILLRWLSNLGECNASNKTDL